MRVLQPFWNDVNLFLKVDNSDPLKLKSGIEIPFRGNHKRIQAYGHWRLVEYHRHLCAFDRNRKVNNSTLVIPIMVFECYNK